MNKGDTKTKFWIFRIFFHDEISILKSRKSTSVKTCIICIM